VGDVQRTYYRSKEEEEFWKAERDPISILSAWLLQENLATAEKLERIRAEAQAEVAAGVEFGLNAPFPEISEVAEHVYA